MKSVGERDGVSADMMTVPEHSVAFMRAMSGGTPRVRDGFLFFTAADWLLAIGYPLAPEPVKADAEAFEQALRSMLREGDVRDCWAVAPRLPESLAAFRTESDAYYTLPAGSAVSARLRNPARKAREVLRIEESREFSAAHRRLWAEFLEFKELKPQARELFVRIPLVLNAPGSDIRLLDARKADGGLAACLVMDYAPADFCVYLIGARSRSAFVPHAGDALFAFMLERARAEGKKFIHLGLGVNEGIRRFKQKWGGSPAVPYEAASFPASALSRMSRVSGGVTAISSGSGLLREAVFSSFLQLQPESDGLTRGGWDFPPEQRPFAMLWRLRKNGRTSWICGTAHTFCYSFARAFKKLFANVDVAVFEGPLDPVSLAAYAGHGQTRDAGTPCLLDYLREEEIRRLERVVQGPRGKIASLLNMTWPRPADVRGILAGHRPWSAFFTLYNAFLERHDWNQSVDLEAWNTAGKMGRRVVSMESLEEQTTSLDNIPLDRIVRFLKNPEDWPRRMKQSRSAYLAGDFRRMLDTGTEFPTRVESVIGARDHRFRERMAPWIEQGRVAVFVGTAHMLNLENMLRGDGFDVEQVPPTWRRRLRACFRKIP